MGGLVLTEYDAMMAGGQKGPVLAAGAPAESRLIGMLSGKIEPLMPMGGEPLPAAEIELLSRWIEQGAKDDTPESEKGPQAPTEPPTYTQPPAVDGLTYSPDGSLLAVGGYKEVLVHKSDGSEIVARLLGKSERITGLAFTPDGKTLVAVGGTPARFGEVQVWDLESNTLLHSVMSTADTLFGGAVSPDGKFVCAGAVDKGVPRFRNRHRKRALQGRAPRRLGARRRLRHRRQEGRGPSDATAPPSWPMPRQVRFSKTSTCYATNSIRSSATRDAITSSSAGLTGSPISI